MGTKGKDTALVKGAGGTTRSVPRCRLRACRRSDEVSGHEEKGYRAGKGRRRDHPKRAEMPLEGVPEE